MNRALSEMLHSMNSPGNNAVTGNCTDMTVLDRQRARLKWQLEQQNAGNDNNNGAATTTYFNAVNEFNGLFYNGPAEPRHGPSFLAMIGAELPLNRAVKPDPGLDNGWPDLDRLDAPLMGYATPAAVQVAGGAILRTSSCPPAEEKLSSGAGKDSFKKRKANERVKVVQEDDNSKEKRVKGSPEAESKISELNSVKVNGKENSGETSKENSKASEIQKPDYIHVRARRGQATDSHSLAERVRREKISERMKYLQDLVPGCNKITGKAGMLDEIINYVQSLQRQVEFLSMKLAAVNPRLDFNIDDLFAKEMFPVGFQTEISNSGNYVQLMNQQQQQVVSCGELEIGLSSQDLALRRTISAPVSIPDQTLFLDTSCYTTHQIQAQPTWDSEFQNLYSAFPSSFTGCIEASHLKMEM